MKRINRLFAIVAVMLVALTTLATAQQVPATTFKQIVLNAAAYPTTPELPGSFQIYGNAGSRTAFAFVAGRDVKFNYSTNPNGDGILEYYVDFFKSTARLYDCTLDKESLTYFDDNFDGTFDRIVASGKGKFTGVVGSVKKAGDAVASVSATLKGGAYGRGETSVIVTKANSSEEWGTYLFMNIYSSFTPPLVTPEN